MNSEMIHSICWNRDLKKCFCRGPDRVTFPCRSVRACRAPFWERLNKRNSQSLCNYQPDPDRTWKMKTYSGRSSVTQSRRQAVTSYTIEVAILSWMPSILRDRLLCEYASTVAHTRWRECKTWPPIGKKNGGLCTIELGQKCESAADR